jgi:hypothetical protein
VVALNVTRYAIGLLLMITVLALIYHFGPSFRHKFQSLTPGAVFTIIIWLLMGLAFKLYLTKFGGAANYNKTYGAVAGAVILLLLFYIDAAVLLIGAEINSEVDFAVLGIRSAADAKPREAPEARDDPEQQAMKRELQEKRAESAAMVVDKVAPTVPFSPPPVPAPDGDPRAGRKSSSITTRALLALGGLWATNAMLKKFRTRRRNAILADVSRDRVRRDLPVTWAAINRPADIDPPVTTDTSRRA